MDYIQGRLTILKDIEALKVKGRFFYTPRGIDLSLAELLPVLTKNMSLFTEGAITLNFLEAGTILTFSTRDNANNLVGKYEAFMYPAEYGTLAHIYCLGVEGGDGAFYADLASAWDYSLINYEGIDYYLYVQDRKVREDNMKYQFLFGTGGH